MKKKIIQLLLIQRLLAGETLIKVKKCLKQGTEPPPKLAAEFNDHCGRITVLLWCLRESDPDKFVNSLETIGMKVDDDEVLDLATLDQQIHILGPHCGIIAGVANKARETEEGGE